MKKFMALLLTGGLMISSAASVNALETEQQPSDAVAYSYCSTAQTPSANTEVRVGDTVTVDYVIGGLSAIGAFNASVSYNSSYLSYVSYTKNAQNCRMIVNEDVNPIKIATMYDEKMLITDYANEPVSAVTLTFKVTKNGSYSDLGIERETTSLTKVEPLSNSKLQATKILGKKINAADNWTALNVGIMSKLENTSSVSSEQAVVGNKTLITGSAKGGSGNYRYEFYYKLSSSSSWSKFSNSALTSTTASLNPSSAGTYNIRVYAKDDAGNVSVKNFTVKYTSAPLVNNTKLSATTANVGNPINILGAASGGTGEYTYEFYYKNSESSSWSKFSASALTATTATLKVSSAGTYNIRVYAKDSAGKTAVKNFSVTFDGVLLTNTSTVSTKTPQLGSSVRITGSAYGGVGGYTYEFYYKKSTVSSWSKFSGSYCTGTTATLKASTAGTYNIRIYAKDSSGKAAVKNIDVVFSGTALTNNTTISNQSVKKGNPIRIVGSAEGGIGDYTYEFYYKKTSTNTWSTFSALYRTDTTATLKPSSSGSYDIRVYVKDSSNNTAVKNFTVKFTD